MAGSMITNYTDSLRLTYFGFRAIEGHKAYPPGKASVLRLTGPTIYTKAIDSAIAQPSSKMLDDRINKR